MKEVRELRQRNATNEESQDCWSGFYFGGDRYDLIHQHCHRKSEIFDEVLSLDVPSIAKTDAVCDQQVHLGNCLLVLKLRCHRTHDVSWLVYVPAAPGCWQLNRSRTL